MLTIQDVPDVYKRQAVQMNEMMQDLQSVAENLRRAANEISEAADGAYNKLPEFSDADFNPTSKITHALLRHSI